MQVDHRACHLISRSVIQPQSPHQVPFGAVGDGNGNLPNGAFLQDWRVSNNRVTDAQRAFEYISLSEPFTADRSILQFNEIIESDLEFEDDGTTPLLGSNGNLAEWALSKTTFSEIKNNSLWFANQSEYFNGRLHLLGLRYDYIKVDSTLRKVYLDGLIQVLMMAKQRPISHI